MKTLVVYYSFTGNTRKVAEELAGRLGADLTELIEERPRKGLSGAIRAIFESLRHRASEITPVTAPLRKYDLIILAAPLWAGHIASPMRDFAERYREELSQVSFVITHGGSSVKKAAKELEEFCGQHPLEVMDIQEVQIKKNKVGRPISAYLAALRRDFADNDNTAHAA